MTSRLNCICISNYRYISQRNQSEQRECNTKWTSYFHIALHTYQAAEKLPAAKLQEYRDIFLYFDRSVKAIFQNWDLINFILRGGAGCIGAEDLTQVSELKKPIDYDIHPHLLKFKSKVSFPEGDALIWMEPQGWGGQGYGQCHRPGQIRRSIQSFNDFNTFIKFLIFCFSLLWYFESF